MHNASRRKFVNTMTSTLAIAEFLWRRCHIKCNLLTKSHCERLTEAERVRISTFEDKSPDSKTINRTKDFVMSMIWIYFRRFEFTGALVRNVRVLTKFNWHWRDKDMISYWFYTKNVLKNGRTPLMKCGKIQFKFFLTQAFWYVWFCHWKRTRWGQPIGCHIEEKINTFEYESANSTIAKPNILNELKRGKFYFF